MDLRRVTCNVVLLSKNTINNLIMNVSLRSQKNFNCADGSQQSTHCDYWKKRLSIKLSNIFFTCNCILDYKESPSFVSRMNYSYKFCFASGRAGRTCNNALSSIWLDFIPDALSPSTEEFGVGKPPMNFSWFVCLWLQSWIESVSAETKQHMNTVKVEISRKISTFFARTSI